MKSEGTSLTSAYLQLHFTVVIWGFTAILGRLLTLAPTDIVLYRTLIASMGMYTLLRWKGIGVTIPRRDLLKILGTGMLISIHWITFFLAARVSNISLCLAGLATASFWTSLIEPMFNKRKIRLYEVILGLLSVAGISIVFRTTIDAPWGLVIAIISAILSAVFTVINGKLIQRHNHYTITFYEMVGAFLGTVLILPMLVAGFEQPWPELMVGLDWGYMLILSLICTVYAFSIGVKLMKQLSAFAINLTVNLEPVYGIIMAVLLFSDEEKMEWNFYAGTLIVLISVLLYPVARRIFHDRYLKLDIFK